MSGLVSVTTHHSGGQKLKQAVAKAQQAQGVDELAVGFFSTARYQDGTPVTNVAAWNEYGTRRRDGSVHIPERPFFRKALASVQGKVDNILAKVDTEKMVVDRKVASLLGETVKSEIQTSIRNLRFPPNAPITISGGWMRNARGKLIRIKGKRSSNPLIDTGFMRLSVSYEVKD